MAGLRRVLVVGCGGSGVSTLCFTLDHLRSELYSRGFDEVPAGWQFVAIDVPVSPQSGPLGLPDVRKLGASYIGTGTTGGYPQVDRAVTGRAATGKVMTEVGTWAPPEGGWGVTVSDGAGQYRAIGRMLTLSKMSMIRSGLEQAWQTLHSSETHSEMAQVIEATGWGEYDRISPPLVLVVSSMAGGAGASMALDVCRTLAGISGLDPNLIAVFMVGADVFSGLPTSARTGVYANSLAMLGEIIACQNGAAADHDRRLWQGLGLGEPSAVPFGRVFPVGKLAGVTRSPFGDGSPMQIYRGMGRALGALMCSQSAMEQFVQYDLTNKPPLPVNQDLCGWGASSDDVVWGSLGFSSLNMGRDRYAEYAAQRLARGAVDRLRTGHEREDVNKKSGSEQLKELLRSQWPQVLSALGMWNGAGKPADWLVETAWPRQELNRVVADAMSAHLIAELPAPEAQDGATWATMVRRRVSDQAASLRRAGDEAAYRWAFDYTAAFHQRILDVVADGATRHGLPYARALADGLAEHLRVIAPRLRELETQHSNVGPERLDPAAETALSGVAKVLRNGQALLDVVLDSVRKALNTRNRGQACGLLAAALEETCGAVLVPLSEAISEQLKDLDHAVKDADTSAGLAQVATDRYVEWPADSDQQVKARFDEATNEVLLTTSADFQTTFEAHVQASLVDRPPYTAAREAVLTQVISGLWPTTGGHSAPGGLVEVTSPAQLRAFPTVPLVAGSATESLTPRPGRYVIHSKPAEVASRARAFIARPGEPFDVFCRESMRSYVAAEGKPDYEKANRREAIRRGFRAALDLALPLATPNQAVVKQLHDVDAVTYRFKFSDVPFKNLEVADVLNQVLTEDDMVDKITVRQAFNSALSDSDVARRIDIFGSYPNYAYLCFDSVLEPAAKEWNQLVGFAAGEFWTGRRARPLPASLPFSEAERRALVAGWLLGQITGHVRVEQDEYGAITSAEVFDASNNKWVSFPEKLLASDEWLVVHPEDALPAVLEASLVAVAQVSGGSLAPLAPYRVLRRLYDDGAVPRPSDRVRAVKLLADWLGGIEVPGGSSAANDTGDRAKAALELLAAYRAVIPPERLIIARPEDGRDLSLRIDLREDLHWAIDQLERLLDLAKPERRKPVGLI
jgi:hypothetical protein